MLWLTFEEDFHQFQFFCPPASIFRWKGSIFGAKIYQNSRISAEITEQSWTFSAYTETLWTNSYRYSRTDFDRDTSCENGTWSPILAPNLEPFHLGVKNSTQHKRGEPQTIPVRSKPCPGSLCPVSGPTAMSGTPTSSLLTRFPKCGSKNGAKFQGFRRNRTRSRKWLLWFTLNLF